MNINRLNYENYFLLYVDGELSAAEMQAVESFAAENEDLADELDKILQTKLPEDFGDTFENKSILLRTVSKQINEINCEEKFLLFVDNELSAEEKNETLDFVTANPQFQAAFLAIKQTQLPLETICFPDKDALYRKETDRKPVILMQWWKLAVAAALIGVIAMVGILTNALQDKKELAKTKQIERSIPTTVPSKAQNIGSNNQIVEEPILAQKNKANNKRSVLQPTLKNEPVQKIIPDNLVAKIETPKQKMEQETIAMNTTIPTNNNPTIDTRSNTHANEISAVSNRIQATDEPSYIKPAVYKELDTDDERKSLYVGSLEINKDKLRGFLRKASSLFKGKNKTEEDKPEISNSHSLE